jgi:hypothetical protein
MDIVRGNHVVKDGQTVTHFGFEDPAQVTVPVACKLREKLFLVTAMSDVPDATGEKMAIRARHDNSLEGAFGDQKQASKPPGDAIYATFCQ